MRRKQTEKLTAIGVAVFFLFLGMAAWIENSEIQTYQKEVLGYRIKQEFERDVTALCFPVFGYTSETLWENELPVNADIFMNELPFYQYIQDEITLKSATEDSYTLAQLQDENGDAVFQLAEDKEGIVNTSLYYEEMRNENHHAAVFTKDTDFFTGGSGFISEISAFWISEFVKAEGKSVVYDEQELQDYKFVMENFYTVDACTTAGPDLIQPAGFMDFDATIDKTLPGPHILIYHTHSQEAFADSIPGDKSTTIVGAGEKLSELLREEYGYEVYHHTGEYDVDTRDDAYAKTAPALEAILEEYPQIQVIIDLHRDGVAEDRHLVADWNGRKVAQFMFFNGLSYINTKGPIDYLPNPNLQANLALSFQASVVANEYYPGLTRRTYLNGYRYNMHYKDKTMLIELGAQTNTVDEVMCACEPLAHILNIVFSGDEKE